ncbi:DUF559 domain-containing protein [Lysobacter sp. UC]|uniref:DUF559 domain-containing protein n=1 Tax=Lysobacter arvi TaxID=3038776 RepID=A0ABU1CEZ1_9GAMM|nr:DUF559 domain-containing protein [Lysobacter arvi]MDR0183520.1 DUF559 domain-containing protein [Lysobacter arvi]
MGPHRRLRLHGGRIDHRTGRRPARRRDAADATRTAHLQALGYGVPRFWNNDVLTRTDAVLDMIHAALAAGPHPNPLP